MYPGRLRPCVPAVRSSAPEARWRDPAVAVAVMRSPAGQREALRDLRRFRRLRWGLIVGPFLVTGVMTVVLRSSEDVVLQACRDSLILVTFVSAIFSLLGYPVCPRCGRSFEARHWGRERIHTAFNPFTRSCLRCGLRVDGNPDEHAQPRVNAEV